MIYLLDAHVYIWLMQEPKRLSSRATSICKDKSNTLLLSLASLWEIQIKSQLGKLNLEVRLETLFDARATLINGELLPIEASHILALNRLPIMHRDPFDRMLVAQALVEACPLVSHDAVMTQFPIDVIW